MTPHETSIIAGRVAYYHVTGPDSGSDWQVAFEAYLASMQKHGYVLVKLPDPIDYIDANDEEMEYQLGYNDCLHTTERTALVFKT
jgi:hypothetical protein